ncbi:hypothetical protein BN1723_020411, partial [Verticillium longisporum]
VGVAQAPRAAAHLQERCHGGPEQ